MKKPASKPIITIQGEIINAQFLSVVSGVLSEDIGIEIFTQYMTFSNTLNGYYLKYRNFQYPDHLPK
ncbi:hypothetical protein [Chitinophaga sp. S165]|uniref:hypothetical protein n=1 Tax=Chitinophaga sp. S165 TaxID=2135462 RepID=UPI001E4C6B9A|nr:hypothetical protein [Chitinophaga sp. S165]